MLLKLPILKIIEFIQTWVNLNHPPLLAITVSPDAIHEHVKTKTDVTTRMQYTAPEYAYEGAIQTAADIYSFGICALEVLALLSY